MRTGKSMDAPLLSIIVPAYNIVPYLPRCIRSITAQTYGNLEILLVNDGSTDGTGVLCDELAREDARIRVFHKENGGSSSARNLALKYARGQYVGFVDSDDYVEPYMYEGLLEGIRKFGAPVAQMGRDEINQDGKRLPNICEPPDRPILIEKEEFLKELLLHRGDCSFCTKLVRRDLFPQEGFPQGELNEDFHLLVKMLSGIDALVSLPQQAYHVFYRVGSNSRKEDKADFSRVYGDSVKNADRVMELVKREYPSLEKVAFRFGIYQRLEYLLHIPVDQMCNRNRMYCEIVKYMRENWIRSMGNPILTVKNKVYHTLFAIAPKMLRKAHAGWRKVKISPGGDSGGENIRSKEAVDEKAE